MNFEVLKGTKDNNPKEQIKINEILDIIKKNFEKYGLRAFDTPIIEYLETLTGKYNDDAEIVQEIYKLNDRGSRKLGLRYDLTVPLCRYVATQKQLKLPFKRYAIGKVFRDGPLKKGRLREFIQCDGDIIGITGREIEAEILDLFFKTYSQIGISSIIEINNNKILRGAFLQAQFKEKDLSSLILSVDKLKKIGIEKVLEEIKEKKLDVKLAKDAIEILKLKSFNEIKKVSKNELLKEGISELEELTKLLDQSKTKYRINFSMSRGLDIYTGNIWEAYDKDEKITSSIGSGGRYDKVIGDYAENGKEYPALGISFGLVPILNCIGEDNSKESLTNILIVPLENNLVSECFKIANQLRNNGKNVEIDYSFKLKKAFDYADYIGVEEIIVFGNKDLENKTYTIKNLKTKEEEKRDF